MLEGGRLAQLECCPDNTKVAGWIPTWATVRCALKKKKKKNLMWDYWSSSWWHRLHSCHLRSVCYYTEVSLWPCDTSLRLMPQHHRWGEARQVQVAWKVRQYLSKQLTQQVLFIMVFIFCILRCFDVSRGPFTPRKSPPFPGLANFWGWWTACLEHLPCADWQIHSL